MTRITAIFLFAVILLSSSFVRAAELLYFYSDLCPWCEAWDRDIGVMYHLTDEAKTAPLRRVDYDEDMPAKLKHLKAIYYTPTFVLMDDGKEIGRILGYPGDEFFWPLLGDLLNKMPTYRLPQAF